MNTSPSWADFPDDFNPNVEPLPPITTQVPDPAPAPAPAPAPSLAPSPAKATAPAQATAQATAPAQATAQATAPAQATAQATAPAQARSPAKARAPARQKVTMLPAIPVAELVRQERDLFLQSAIFEFLKEQGWQHKIDAIVQNFDIVIGIIENNPGPN